MKEKIWESDGPSTMPASTEINTAVIVRISLGASRGSRGSPNRISLEIAGYCKLTGNDSADCLIQVQNYVKLPGNRPLTHRSDRDRSVVGGSHPTDMSLKFNMPCHLVVHLDDSLAWFFARNFRPFSRPKGKIFETVFTNPQLIDPSGKLHPVGTDGSGAIESCRFATMIFDPKPIGQQRQEGGYQNFVAPFNINVELMDNPGNVDSYVPIIIDPDVRWPGGDGP